MRYVSLQMNDGKVVLPDRFTQFLCAIRNESDRGAVIIVATILEERLRETLFTSLVGEPESSHFLKRHFQALDSLARASFCLGLISRRELNAINTIRLLRNSFAHQFMTNKFAGTLESSRSELIKAACAYFPGLSQDYPSARAAFDHLSANLIIELWARAEEIAKEGPVATLRED